MSKEEDQIKVSPFFKLSPKTFCEWLFLTVPFLPENLRLVCKSDLGNSWRSRAYPDHLIGLKRGFFLPGSKEITTQIPTIFHRQITLFDVLFHISSENLPDFQLGRAPSIPTGRRNVSEKARSFQSIRFDYRLLRSPVIYKAFGYSFAPFLESMRNKMYSLRGKG